MPLREDERLPYLLWDWLGLRKLRRQGCMCGAGMREPPNWYDDNADNPPWIKALAEVRHLAPREGWCYQHVQAIIVDTPKRRSATENPFLIKPHGKASFIARAGQSATEYQFGYVQNRKSKRRAASRPFPSGRWLSIVRPKCSPTRYG